MSTLNHAFAIIGWALLALVLIALLVRSRREARRRQGTGQAERPDTDVRTAPTDDGL